MTFFYDLNKKLDGILQKPTQLTEGKKPDFLDLDKDGDKKEPMKKAVADKTAGPKKGVNPFVKVKEGAKPDFLDMDKDGNKKESMRKAARDKETINKKLDEIDMNLIKALQGGTNWKKTSDAESDRNIHKKYGYRGDRDDTGNDDDYDEYGNLKPSAKKRVAAASSDGTRGRGRPKGTGRSIGAKGPSGKSKLMTREEIEEAISALESCGYQVSQLDEKAVSVAQRKAAGIAHAAQKGEIPKSKLSGASKEMAKMPKGEVHKFAATKEKGLPKKKEEPVDETTVSGSVAVAVSGGKNKEAPAKAKTSSGKSGMQFGKGIYEGGLNESLEKRISEIMNEGITVNVSQPDSGEPSVTISGTGEDAIKLGELLKLSGMFSSGGYNNVCPSCGGMHEGMGSCQMTETDLANSADNTETMDTDYMVNTLAGGLNGPKTTGQTTIPVINQDPARGSLGPVVESKNDLVELYKRIA